MVVDREHLELRVVDVEVVVRAVGVGDFPDLRRTDLHHFIDAGHVHGPAVDLAALHLEGADLGALDVDVRWRCQVVGNLRRSAQVVVGPQLDYVELVAAAVEPVGEPVRSQVGRIGAQDHGLARSHVHDDLGALGGREQEPVHVTGAGSRPPPLPIMANARSSEKPKANTRVTDALSSRNRTFSVVRRGRGRRCR